MAKALFGHVGGPDPRMVSEMRRLQQRVRDLEAELVRLQEENDALAVEAGHDEDMLVAGPRACVRLTDAGGTRQNDRNGSGAPLAPLFVVYLPVICHMSLVTRAVTAHPDQIGSGCG